MRYLFSIQQLQQFDGKVIWFQFTAQWYNKTFYVFRPTRLGMAANGIGISINTQEIIYAWI